MTALDVGGTRSPAAVRERRGLLLAFAAFGLFWGAWAAVLPDVRGRSDLTDGSLGLALGAIAVAALPAMPLAGRLVDRYGPRLLLPGALGAFAVVTALLGFAAPPAALVGALVLLGATTGVLDVTVNAATAAWERVESGRLMSAGHGCFSLGVLAGAALTGFARGAGAGPAAVLGVVATVVGASALAQPAYRRTDGAAAPPAAERGARRLAPVLLGLGAVVGCSFLIEDAVQSWSALHLEGSLDAPPWVGGLGPGLFAGTMAAGRLGAHLLVRPGREAAAVGVGGVVTGLGLLVLAAAPTAWVGLAGAAVAGAGVSVLAPTLLSAVGARSEPGRQGADLALVTAFGYSGFVLGPLLVGLLSAALSLPVALGLLAVLASAIAAAGPLLLRTRPRASARPEGAR
ncbi:MAG TPA: MFS transporter [Mycobacteriales bacterium]|nr:MFS transporter [Mycobacteriales bacterium]